MTLSQKKLLAASAIVLGLGLTTACSSSDSPSSPSSPNSPNAPRIVSLSPGTPPASGAALVKGRHPVDVSLSAGFHLANSDFGNQTGVDVTIVGSHAATPKLDLYAALDMAFNKYRDRFPGNSYTQAHLVPGIEYKVHQDLDLLAELGIALNDRGDNYVSFGLAYYVR